jgi:hypothetical protein
MNSKYKMKGISLSSYFILLKTIAKITDRHKMAEKKFIGVKIMAVLKF